LWQVSDDRVHRWRARHRRAGTLVDRAPGGNPVHGILPDEIDAILAVAERWGPIDRSHRKLAHRGSYEGLVWVAPSTFRRVLAAHGLVLPEPSARTRAEKRPWPEWLEWLPNRIWIYDATHFTRCRRVVFAIADMVSRRWIDTLVSVEETATPVQVIFEHALEIEGLLELLTDERLDLAVDDPARPILLAVSLALLRAHHDAVRRTASGSVDRDRFVFTADAQGAHPWRPNWVTKRFIATRTAAGLGRFRLHDLRHFMATEMLNKHVPLPTVSGRLAHAQMSTTLNVYAHAVPSGDRPAATLIADLVIGAHTPEPRPSPARLHPRAHAGALRPARYSHQCNRRPST
jgi:integrase